MDKYEAYLQIKRRYLDEKVLYGGVERTTPIINRASFDSLVSYLSAVNRKLIPERTNKKFLVILYGPPASGKSLARKVACHIIKTRFHEELEKQDIFKTFIDTNVDDLTYDAEYMNSGERVLDVLKRNFAQQMGDRGANKDDVEDIKQNIDTLAQSSFDIYRAHRQDALSELLLYLGAFLERNIFFETATPDELYIEKLIKSLEFYNYIPIVIYPYTNNLAEVSRRMINRGREEGRFLHITGSFGLETKISINIEGFKKLKQIAHTFKKILIVKYNTDMPEAIYEQLSRFDFTRFEEILLEIVENNIF